MIRSILLSFLFLSTVLRLDAQCDNVTEGGAIGPDQVYCEASADPALIESLSLPQGGTGDLEYIWISTTQNPASPTVVWFPIEDSTGPEYDPSPISQTTYYRRCAGRSGCTEYIGESNIVAVIVGEDCDTPCEFFKITADVSNPACGESMGSVSFSVVAGTLPLSYTINGASVEELPESLVIGIYTVTAVDAEGCTDTIEFEVQETENNIEISAETGDAVCTQANGFINLTVTGAEEEITYQWNDGATSEDRENLPAGIYSVTISDSSTCSAEASFEIGTDNGDLSINTTNLLDVSCNGGNDGAINLEINGGTAPYFTLVNGQADSDLSNLAADDYQIIVSDANGCFTEEIVTINQAPAIMLSGLVTDPLCGLSNGSIELNISGGTVNSPEDYQINWSTGNGMNLAPGFYSVTVTDLNNCEAAEGFSLSNSGGDLAIDIIQTSPASCSGAEDGSAEFAFSGGMPPYTFNINGEDFDALPESYAPGMYQVLIFDSMGCAAETFFEITSSSGIEVTTSITNASCGQNDGSIDITVSGGSTPYTFNWSNEAETEDITELPPGFYGLTITDNSGCTFINSEPYEVSIEGSAIEVMVSVTNVSCKGGNDGAVELTFNSGAAPFSYILNGNEVSDLPNNLEAGNYELLITDANACSTVATFTITEPEPLVFNSTSTNASCGQDNGSISIEPLGGTAPYTFNWSNGATGATLENLAPGTYNLTLTDSQGCTVFSFDPFEIINEGEVNFLANLISTTCGEANGSIELFLPNGDFDIIWSDGIAINSAFRNNLAAGSYGVTVTDENLCSAEASYTVESSEAFFAMITPVNTTCNGGNDGGITMGFVGGTAPFQYNLNGVDIDGLPGNLSADNYQLIITDALGCTALAEFVIGEPDEIIYLAEFTEADCPGDAASIEILQIVGGTGNYSVLWSDGSTELSRNDLEVGTYTFTITDDLGCTASSELFTIAIPVPINVTAAGEIQNVSCVGETDGFVDISVSGGTAPYSYFWSTGAETEDIDNLAPGDYTLQIVDAAGCTEVFLAVITEPEPLQVEIEVVPADCELSNGSATVFPSGGTQPYFYNWETGGTLATENNLAPGVYKVTVSDFGTCEIILEINVEELDCFGSESGEDFRFVAVSANADVETSQVSLTWETADEAIESYFILEHSIDNETFESITGLLPGEGLSASTNSYAFMCENMAVGTHYFRIRYVDPFGNLETSELISAFLSPTKANDFSLYPNPSEGEVNLNLLVPTELNTQYRLINGQGIVVSQAEVPLGSVLISLQTQELKSGIYYVEVSREGLRKLTKRLLIL